MVSEGLSPPSLVVSNRTITGYGKRSTSLALHTDFHGVCLTTAVRDHPQHSLIYNLASSFSYRDVVIMLGSVDERTGIAMEPVYDLFVDSLLQVSASD